MVTAYDHGNNFGKDSAGNIFENGYQISLYPTGAADELYYNNKYYNFGNRAPVNMEKTKGERMMVCTLYSLGLQLTEKKTNSARTQQVTLGVDIPISRYGAEREFYKGYYLDKTVEFGFRGKEWIVHFEDVYVYPQGFIIWAVEAPKEAIEKVNEYFRKNNMPYMMREVAENAWVCDLEGNIKYYKRRIN